MQTSVQKITPYRVIATILLSLLVVFFAFPLYWILTGTFKSQKVIISSKPQWFPLETLNLSEPGWVAFLSRVGIALLAAIIIMVVLLILRKRKKVSNLVVVISGVVLLGIVAAVLANFLRLNGVAWESPSQLASYVRLFNKPALSWLYNTLFICLMAMLLTSITATMAGYAIAKKRFAGRALIFSIFVMAMALPKQVILIPLLKEMSFLKLHDTAWAVIFPTVGWPFGVFLMKQFSENIPGSILEATRIDGAGEIQTFIQIVLPMVSPGIGALAIFTFISTWNDYFMQLLMLHSEKQFTISVGIAKLQQEMSSDFGMIMVGAALAAVPIVATFLIFQRFFTRGITLGAVKG